MANDPIYIPGNRRPTTNNGGGGDGEDNSIELSFNYSSGASSLIWNAESGDIVFEVKLLISQVFDGTVTISVGEAGFTQRLMRTTENDPYELGVYSVQPVYTYTGNTAVLLYLNVTGSTQGQGKVIVINNH